MNEFTVKEIADLLEVSKTTVQKYIKKTRLSYDHISKNKQFYSYDKVRRIIKAIKPDYDLAAFDLENNTENSKENLENSKAETENSKENLENSKAETENSKEKQDITEKMLEMLQKEIDKKDQEIKDLRDKLDKAYGTIADMANKAQYITAADKTAQIIDKSQVQDEISQDQEKKNEPAADFPKYDETQQLKETKKGFFSRLFGRG